MEIIEEAGREFRLWTFEGSDPRFTIAREVVGDAFVEVEASGPARNLAADLLSATAYDPATDIGDWVLPTTGTATAALEGLTLDEAHLVAIAEGWRLQTSSLDGVRLDQTADFQPNRVNLVVADGRIVGAESVG